MSATTEHDTPRTPGTPTGRRDGETYTGHFEPYAGGGGWHGVTGTADCGHTYTNVEHGRATPFTGYAVDSETGRTACYACADAAARAEVVAAEVGDRRTGYLSADGRTVATWTGGELLRVTSLSDPWRAGSHGSPMVAVTATGPGGTVWRGRGGGRGYILTMRRVS